MSQREHDDDWFKTLAEIENDLDVEVRGMSDLQAILEGRYGSHRDVMLVRLSKDDLRHGGFLPPPPRRRTSSGGVRHGDPRGLASPRRVSLGGPSAQGRPSGGGPSGGAFGGGGGGAGRHSSRSAASRPATQRPRTATGGSQPATQRPLTATGGSQPSTGGSGPTRRATLPAAAPTKRYGDAEDMAARAKKE